MSTAVLLPGDDPAEYEALLDEFTLHFEPEDLTERRYVREMADAEWRLRRVRDWEQRLMETAVANLLAETPGLDPRRHRQREPRSQLHYTLTGPLPQRDNLSNSSESF